jgi:hypothetical protein
MVCSSSHLPLSHLRLSLISLEMVDVVRSAVESQRGLSLFLSPSLSLSPSLLSLLTESLKKIQFKIATVEHLTLLSETICSKYYQLKQTYESTSKKSLKGVPQKPQELSLAGYKASVSSQSSNRTSVHFNKLIIDERRKLDVLEKKIKDAMKGLGRLEPHEMYEDPDRQEENREDSPRLSSNGMNETKQPFTPQLRRASVSLRQALATTTTASSPTIQQRRPFQANDDDEREAFGMRRMGTSHPAASVSSNRLFTLGSSSSFDPDSSFEADNTFGLTKHEIDRKMLFKKSESDRLQLIEENRRLRGEITHVTSRLIPRSDEMEDDGHGDGNSYGHDGSTDNLTYVVNELNGWDIERDELDSQIDRLTAQKEELIQKLTSTSRGSYYKEKWSTNTLN